MGKNVMTSEPADTAWISGLLDQVDKERLETHLQYLCGFEKLSGEPEALQAVDYITETLKQYGIACETERFDAYVSNPAESMLLVNGTVVPSRSRSFAACCDTVTAELVYDRGTKETVSPREQETFFRTVRGKLVLGYSYDERYAKILERYGAAGWIQIWRSGEEQIHEDTVSPVWGTPDMDTCLFQLNLPVIAISGPEGEKLIRLVQEQTAKGCSQEASMSCRVETGVKQVALPVATIPGKSEDFVLLSGHYDTWYIGAFDNGTANGAALEIARILNKNQERLQRSVRLAWWPGHSNGRYMGSTWYCDHHWDELREHCIAHINLDLMGCKGADHTLAVRTAGLEGMEWLRSLVLLADPEAVLKTGRIGRGADQSFWGAEIPYHLNPRYEITPEKKPTATPGAGMYWWHTADDTFDKIDFDVLRRDTRVTLALLLGFVGESSLPADFSEYFQMWDGYLQAMGESEEHQEAVNEVRTLIAQLAKFCTEPEASSQEKEHNRLCRLVGGTVTRLMHMSGSPYEQDTSFAYGPLHLFAASCRMKQDDSPADWHLFYHTTFIRQRNRMVTELTNLIRILKGELIL